MKKLMMIAIIAGAFAACNDGSNNDAEMQDSTDIRNRQMDTGLYRSGDSAMQDTIRSPATGNQSQPNSGQDSIRQRY